MKMEETNQDLLQLVRDYLGMIWRQKMWIILPLIGGILIAGILIVKLPKIYRSTTLILVEAQKVPEEYVKSAVSGTVEGRLSTIQQQIMSRSLIEKIINKFGLYPENSNGVITEEAIGRMRNNIEVRTTVARNNNIEAFSLSFQGKDPVMVMNVTNELASLFIEENLKIREQLVEGTTEFLDNELKNLKETLERQEARIGEFKRMNMGELPQQLEANLRSLDRIQSDLLATQLAKRSAQDRKLVLEKTIELTRQRIERAANQERGIEDNALLESGIAPPTTERAPSQQMLKLIQKKMDLANLQTEYKETYPDIIMLKREIQELEDQVALTEMSEAGTLPAGLREPGQSNQNDRRRAPLRVPMGFELERAHIAESQRQIQAIEVELNTLTEREIGLQRQIQLYERRVESVPAREQELAVLERDYENTKKNYESLLDKKLNAQISENLEKRQKGEQFRILDPANLPERPFKPVPLQIGLMGIAGGLGLGVALAFIREKLDSSIRKPEEVERITSVPVLASIPDFDEELMITEKYLSKTAVNDEKTNGKTSHT
ncbi:MAG: Wzz/FepE/Etk N-terminal domain-containing protein [Candidatus Manganitrophus sp.]|nr:Wzz/FepE/Etk N-terminal domain-containing protein [Candidatus Manganitrophus sp.]WDT72726.1 MAG: Wzz/FepE/Etk N-terminal domain-containing protein [Candidatus Manganitrophus sp.]